jgi:release factor glutamine methyltransferase
VAADEEADELLAAAPDEATLNDYVGRRERGEPLAWITGAWGFCGEVVRVDTGVYVPRWQTEELARRAGSLLTSGRARAADLCTGSGAVAVHLMAVAPVAVIVGVDIDLKAARCARGNGVRAVVGDLGECLRPGVFDVVTAVAPYVPTESMRFLPADVQAYEPARALDGGPDGLTVLRRLVATAARLLSPGGWLLIEVGGEQVRALEPRLAAHGLARQDVWSDEDGDVRGLSARKVSE